MKQHSIYHCTGSCKGVSDKPGNCGAKSCERFNKPLKEYTAKDECCGGTSSDCACRCS